MKQELIYNILKKTQELTSRNCRSVMRTPCKHLKMENFATIPVLQINVISLPVTMNRKIKKTTGQIKFSAVLILYQIKTSPKDILYVNKC